MYFLVFLCEIFNVQKVLCLHFYPCFLWYFEQKGVDNPERFLGELENNNAQHSMSKMNPIQANQDFSQNQVMNVEEQNQLNPQLQNIDMNILAILLGIMQQVNKEKGDKAKPVDFIKVLESVIEQSKEKEEKNEIQELQK